MAKLELALLVGDESKKWLAKLETLVTRLEAACGDKRDAAPDVEEDDEVEDLAPKKKVKKVDLEEEEDEDLAPKKKAKKVDLEDEDEEEEEDEDEDSDEEELTVDDVHAACKERVTRLRADGMALKEARADVIGILKKKFKVKEVAELDSDAYPAVIKAMKRA